MDKAGVITFSWGSKKLPEGQWPWIRVGRMGAFRTGTLRRGHLGRGRNMGRAGNDAGALQRSSLICMEVWTLCCRQKRTNKGL